MPEPCGCSDAFAADAISRIRGRNAAMRGMELKPQVVRVSIRDRMRERRRMEALGARP